MIILAVDTDTDQLKILVRQLGRIFPAETVVSYADPLLAVKYSFSHRVQVLFTAVSMRGLDGADVAEGVRRNNADLKICYLAAAEELDSLDGAESYLVKPVNEKAIENVCYTLVG